MIEVRLAVMIVPRPGWRCHRPDPAHQSYHVCQYKDQGARLEEQQRELAAILEDADRVEAPTFAVDLMGAQLSFAAFSYVMVQHEAIHHGEWSLYAAQSGFAVPSLWAVEWGLGPWTKA